MVTTSIVEGADAGDSGKRVVVEFVSEEREGKKADELDAVKNVVDLPKKDVQDCYHLMGNRPLSESTEKDAPRMLKARAKRGWKKIRASLPREQVNHEQSTELTGRSACGTFRQSLLLQVAVGFIFYFISGVIVYGYGEGWTVEESLFYLTVTATTVGYGDLHPQTTFTKVFTMIFATYGICLIGVLVGAAVNIMIKEELEKAKVAKDLKKQEVMDAFSEDKEYEHEAMESSERCCSGSVVSFIKTSGPILKAFVLLGIGTIVFTFQERWSILDSMYCSVITSTTIGYGDFIPSESRWFCFLFIPASVIVMTDVIGMIVASVVESEMSKIQDQMCRRELTIDDLIAMDDDGDGQVTKAEFFEFMLKAMHKVDDEIFNSLHDAFNRMDADKSGTLEMSDLKDLASRKEKAREKKKLLELEKYKNRLAEKGSIKALPKSRLTFLTLSAQVEHDESNSIS